MGQCCGSKDLPDPYNLSGSVLRDRGLDPNPTKKAQKVLKIFAINLFFFNAQSRFFRLGLYLFRPGNILFSCLICTVGVYG